MAYRQSRRPTPRRRAAGASVQAKRASGVPLALILTFATAAGAWVDIHDRPGSPIPGMPGVRDGMALLSLAEAIPVGAFRGLYFDNEDLTNQTVERVDKAIDFDWGPGSPDPSIGPDTFSVRWEGYWDFDRSGTHRFTMTTDDGMRVWVDNGTILDAWFLQSPTKYVVNLTLEQGQHFLKVEYFEHTGGAVAKVSWAPPPLKIPTGAFRGRYYDNENLTNFKLDRIDAAIDFDWGPGSPDASIGPDTFSVRWEGYWDFNTSGPYTFNVTTDDGIRVWIDNGKILDSWIVQPPTTYVVNVSLGTGTHFLKVEYFEHLGMAVAKVSWAFLPPSLAIPVDAFRGLYFADENLTVRKIERIDAAIDFDWGTGSPDPSIGPNTFSVRWEGYWIFGQAGTYRFTMTTDDGMRVWVDNASLLDAWFVQGATTYTRDWNWTPGQHLVEVEYFEQRGNATAQVSWALLLPLLQVSAEASRAAANVNQSVDFSCSVSGGMPPYAYAWTFGDGDSANGSTTSHMYRTPGTKTATCMVTDGASQMANAFMSVVISPEPAVAASVDHPAATPGTSFTFSAQATGGPGTFASYEWSFGDGTNGSGQEVMHAYADAGQFPVVVVVTDANGGVASDSLTLLVSFIELTGSASTRRAPPGTIVFFNASADGGAGAPFSYAWDFGDGSNGSGASISHVYLTSGNFTPSVQVTDGLGASALAHLPTISIGTMETPGSPLGVTIQMSPASPMVNETAFFVATGEGGSGSYSCSWDFGGLDMSTGCEASHVWPESGLYVVEVTLSDSGGNRTTKSLVVDVVPPLAATFVIEPLSPSPGQAASLTARPAGGTGGYACAWDFGDSQGGPDCTVTHAWSSSGPHVVVLTVTDSQGHSAIATETVVIQPADEGAPPGQGTLGSPWDDGYTRVLAGMSFLVAIALVWWWRARRKEVDSDLEEMERFLKRVR
jgi:chitodextrinase